MIPNLQPLIFVFLLQTIETVDAAESYCKPSSNPAYPNITLSAFNKRCTEFCSQLADAGFGSRTVGYSHPLATISFSKVEDGCKIMSKEDCLKGLKDLGDSCKFTQPSPSLSTPSESAYLQGHSSLLTTCGTFNLTILPALSSLQVPLDPASNTTLNENGIEVDLPTSAGSSQDDDDQLDFEDDGSGYASSASVGNGPARGIVFVWGAIFGGVLALL